MFNSADSLQKTIHKRVFIVVIVIAAMSLIAGTTEWALGIIIGGMCSLAHFKSICVFANKLMDMPALQAQKAATVGYLLRYVFTAGVLGVSMFRPEVAFESVVIGLLLVKLAIISEAARQHLNFSLSDQLKRVKTQLEGRE